MIKKLLLTSTYVLLVMLIGMQSVNAQNVRSYTEDFSVSVGPTPPTGWTTTNNQSNTLANAFWKFGNYSGSFNYDTQGTSDHTGNGSQFAWVDGSTPYGNGLSVHMETKSFDFTNHWNLVLEFWHVSYNTTYSSSGHNTFSIDYYDGAVWHLGVFTQKGNNPTASWTKKTVDLSSMQPQGTEQIKFRFNNLKDAATAFYNDIGIDDFSITGEEAMLGMNNAAALGKVRETVCLGNQDIDVWVSNRGVNQIDSVELHWTVDGVAQPMVMYKQTLDTLSGVGTHTDMVTLGQVNFAFGVPKTIKYWTSLPNGVVDTINDNDTSEFVQYAALNGVYTVGGGSADIPTVDSVEWLLNNVGICGPVTFRLKDSTFVDRIWLDRVPGNNKLNTITFESQGGDRTMCTLTDTTTNSVSNYTVILDTTNHVEFKDMTISNGAIGSYAGVIDLRSGANNVLFNNCHILSSYTGSSVNAYLVKSGDEASADEIWFDDCLLENGSWAIHFEGTKNTPQMGLYVENCDFLNNTRSSVWTNYVGDIELFGNTLKSNSTNTGTAAINLSNTDGYIELYGNRIYHAAAWPQKGIVVSASNGLSTKHNLIMNNAFSVGDTGTSAPTTLKVGIDLDNVAFYDVFFNTVAISTGNITSSAFEISNSNGNLIHNNVFANMGTGGVAVDISGLGSVLSMDNNLLYTMTANIGDFNGTALSNFAAWQNNTGFDAGSVSEDPMFRAIDTLKICSKAADNIGAAGGLLSDIDGNLRDPQSPDPGAYEYSAISGITVDDANICNGDEAEFFVAGGSNDVIIWNHTDTSNSFKTMMAGTYTLTAIGECGADTTSFQVLINDLVQLPSDTNICGGDTLMVTSNISNATSYTWNHGPTSASVGLWKTGQYYVAVVDSDGCFSSDTIEVVTSQVAVLRGDTGVCEGHTVLLNPNTPAGTYTWYRGNVSISTATQIFADSAGKYFVIYVDAKSCTSSDTFNLMSYANPRATFTETQSQSNIEFTADDSTGTNYYWSFGDGKSVNGPAWHTLNKYAANGTYTVTLTVTSAHCGDSTYTKELVIEHIGINDMNDANAFSIYPNPNNGIFSLHGNFNEKQSIEVMTSTGQVVFTEGLSSNSEIAIDLVDKLSTGVYYIQLKSENEILFTNKIVVQ